MSKFTNMCVTLIALNVLLSCAAPYQHVLSRGQIQCTGRDGQIIYTGPYNAENPDEYIVQVDDLTRDFYHKNACQKLAG